MTPDAAERRPQPTAGVPENNPLDGKIPDPVLTGDYPMRVLALSAERDQAQRRELAAEAAGFVRGREAGDEEGYRRGRSDERAIWLAMFAPARAAALRTASNPDFAELEERRWGPGGRTHFGNPRPGDFTGRSDAA